MGERNLGGKDDNHKKLDNSLAVVAMATPLVFGAGDLTWESETSALRMITPKINVSHSSKRRNRNDVGIVFGRGFLTWAYKISTAKMITSKNGKFSCNRTKRNDDGILFGYVSGT